LALLAATQANAAQSPIPPSAKCVSLALNDSSSNAEKLFDKLTEQGCFNKNPFDVTQQDLDAADPNSAYCLSVVAPANKLFRSVDKRNALINKMQKQVFSVNKKIKRVKVKLTRNGKVSSASKKKLKRYQRQLKRLNRKLQNQTGVFFGVPFTKYILTTYSLYADGCLRNQQIKHTRLFGSSGLAIEKDIFNSIAQEKAGNN
jgi:valyl-tRNA synthetase